MLDLFAFPFCFTNKMIEGDCKFNKENKKLWPTTTTTTHVYVKMISIVYRKNNNNTNQNEQTNEKMGVGWIWTYTMNWQCLQDIEKKKMKQIEKIMKIDINASLIKRPVERNKQSKRVE